MRSSFHWSLWSVSRAGTGHNLNSANVISEKGTHENSILSLNKDTAKLFPLIPDHLQQPSTSPSPPQSNKTTNSILKNSALLIHTPPNTDITPPSHLKRKILSPQKSENTPSLKPPNTLTQRIITSRAFSFPSVHLALRYFPHP
ncbi:unnamed protein product [Periconia digitata]|uniref:Uncharacterized protein n=1 Tax=Periconia digitata TaxID=1303443 RepID=A0A9W4XI23_9PLEO|nr:unnamed protein product [Periconia digitata]